MSRCEPSPTTSRPATTTCRTSAPDAANTTPDGSIPAVRPNPGRRGRSPRPDLRQRPNLGPADGGCRPASRSSLGARVPRVPGWPGGVQLEPRVSSKPSTTACVAADAQPHPGVRSARAGPCRRRGRVRSSGRSRRARAAPSRSMEPGQVGGVHGDEPLGQRPAVVQQLGRSAAVSGQALLVLGPLLGKVDVHDALTVHKRQLVGRNSADRVDRRADPEQVVFLQPTQRASADASAEPSKKRRWTSSGSTPMPPAR